MVASKDAIDAFEKEKGGLHGKFKLTTSFSTNNMTAFDTNGRITSYKSSVDILKEWFRQRFVFYIAVSCVAIDE